MREKKLTPMQEAIDKVQSLKQIDAVINPIDVVTTILKQMLEKERKVMCDFQNKANFYDYWEKYNGSEDCFDKTFKTEE